MARTRIFDGGFVLPRLHTFSLIPLSELHIIALHVLCKVLPDVLYGAIAPLPAGHPACIPERDNIYMFLQLFCHDLTPSAHSCASCAVSGAQPQSAWFLPLPTGAHAGSGRMLLPDGSFCLCLICSYSLLTPNCIFFQRPVTGHDAPETGMRDRYPWQQLPPGSRLRSRHC